MAPLFILRLSCLLLLTLVACTTLVETSLPTPTAAPIPISTSTPPRATPSPDPALLPIYPIITNTPTFTPQQMDERAIYAYLLDNPPYPFHPPTNMTRLSEWSLIWDLDHLVNYEHVQTAIPAMTPALWDEFRTKNSIAQFIPHELPTWETYGWLSHEILAGAFRRENSMYANWLEYYDTLEYKGGIELPEGGYMVFSRVAFLDENHAFLVVRVECGLGCTRAFLYLFGRENDEWEMVSETTLWEEGTWEMARLMVSQVPNEVLEGTPTPTISVIILPEATPLTIPSITPIPPTPTPIPLTDPQRAALEAEVYAVVYQTDIADKVGDKPIWIADTTLPFTRGFVNSPYPEEREVLPRQFHYLESLHQSFTHDTWADFISLNYDTYIIPTAIPLKKSYTFISDMNIKTLIEEKESGLYEGYILHFSRVGFNADFTQALVYSQYKCGAVCSGGDLYILEFREGKWVVTVQADVLV